MRVCDDRRVGDYLAEVGEALASDVCRILRPVDDAAAAGRDDHLHTASRLGNGVAVVVAAEPQANARLLRQLEHSVSRVHIPVGPAALFILAADERRHMAEHNHVHRTLCGTRELLLNPLILRSPELLGVRVIAIVLRVDGDVKDAAGPEGEVIVAKPRAIACDVLCGGALANVVVARLQDDGNGRVHLHERFLDGGHLPCGDLRIFGGERVDQVAADDQEARVKRVHFVHGQP
mmetsp:Transcript_41078/g.102160  ORF Transcript_41078/g.102160 Transcript_41078/m.102160 type:complete len:234 (-) Transcript_41078:947-1648(-)